MFLCVVLVMSLKAVFWLVDTTQEEDGESIVRAMQYENLATLCLGKDQ